MTEHADPLNVPRQGCCKFSVAIYNANARDALKENRPYDVYDEKWAEERNVEVVADTADEARAKVLEQHPESEGFVVTGVEKLPFSI
ncbi:hypothetical protein C882_0128 [Caenispirillum salinarum AK4]|uniref:Uncharacterized protein n=1 Tax=Caenispirillum salinarum AK4 TaxID=1238182 RepID=K9GXQ7_9PROT|nr:hypothetical protein [Caenispirillum salinarum]EKV30047.1 hypothetical protein C882_0128 [Caenispirillum salinarum AK4]